MSDLTPGIPWSTVLEACGFLLCSLVGYIVHTHDRRLDKIEKDSNLSATAVEFEQHSRDDRENFIRLYQAQAEIKDKLNDGFTKVNENLHAIHVTMMDKINTKADRRATDQ